LSSPVLCADRLSATLRQLRQRANLSGIEAARRAGMSQATVSRFETGKRVPTEDDIRALCEAYRATPEVLQGLLRIADDLRAGATSTRTVLHHHGAPSMQARIGRIEANSAQIRSFTPPSCSVCSKPTTTPERCCPADLPAGSWTRWSPHA